VPEPVIFGKDEYPGSEEDKGDEVERRIKVCETRRCRSLQDVDAVKIEVFLTGLCHNTSKAVGKHTGERSSKQDGTESDEEDHQWWAKILVNVTHDVESYTSVAVEDLGDVENHRANRERIASNERKRGQEPHVDDNDKDHKLDEVFTHLLQAGNQGTPVRA
jgi:hypothetical protein